MSEFKLGTYQGKFCVVWRDEQGNRKRTSLGTADRSEAQRLFARAVADLQRHSAGEASTVDGIFDAYIADREAVGKNAARIRYAKQALSPMFGPIAPHSITPQLCRRYADKAMARGKSKATVHTELGYLRAAVKFAGNHMALRNPPYIWLPSKGEPRDRYLSKGEARALVDACEFPHMKLFVILALTTAARAGALLDLTWDRVDLERRRIALRDPDRPATRKGRATVPVNDWALEALSEAQKWAVSDYVISWGGGQVGSIKKGFKAAVVRAGIEPCTPHTLRHTAAVWMAEGGVPMTEIAAYLGHNDSRTTERVYAKFSPDYLRKAASSLTL
jgi:integrase